MSDEKEILEIRDKFENLLNIKIDEEITYSFTVEESKQILNLITNLQKEIDYLQKDRDKSNELLIELSRKIDIAREYIKYNATSNYFDEEKNMYRRELDLLKILEGDENGNN